MAINRQSLMPAVRIEAPAKLAVVRGQGELLRITEPCPGGGGFIEH